MPVKSRPACRTIRERVLTTTTLAALLALGISTSAQAGTYVINDCPAAQTGNYTVGPWTQFGSVPAPGGFKQTCATPGDSFGISSGGLSVNGTAGEAIQAPASITMQNIKLWWEAPKPTNGGGWSYGLIDVDSPGWSRVFQAATPVAAAGRGGQSAPTELSLPTNTSRLTVEIYCTTSQDCSYGQNPLEIFGAQLTLSDSGLPKGTVTGGGLAGSGPVSGTESASYEADDTGSGIRLVELLVDGQPVVKKDYLAQCPYQAFAACPPTVSDIISWDANSVSAGTHEVALRIVNAGGNATVVDDHSITTGSTSSKNSGETNGSNGTAGSNGSNGTNGAGGSGGSGAGSGSPVTVNLVGGGSTGASQGSVPLGSSARWSLSLRVSPHTVHRHTKIHLSGVVSTSPRPAAGKLIYLQARLVTVAWKGKGHRRHRATEYGTWHSFQIFRAKSSGTFSSTYTFRLGGTYTYQFRAVAPAEGQYRNRTGASAPTTVHET